MGNIIENLGIRASKNFYKTSIVRSKYFTYIARNRLHNSVEAPFRCVKISRNLSFVDFFLKSKIKFDILSNYVEISNSEYPTANFAVFVVKLSWFLNPYVGAHPSEQGESCFSLRGSTKGMTFLSINEPKPRRKFFVICFMRSAEI